MSDSSKAKSAAKQRRSPIRQTEVPNYSLEQALRIPEAIYENYAGKPTKPLSVASAIDIQPSSSYFRQLCGAAIAYGLTEGGYNAKEIAVTQLAKRILRPLAENDDLFAKREAFLRPRVIGSFLRKYDGSPLPKQKIGKNVLHEMEVPEDRTAEVLSLIIEEATRLGLVKGIKGKQYVDIQSSQVESEELSVASDEYSQDTEEVPAQDHEQRPDGPVDSAVKPPADRRLRRVFITHGKNKEFIEPIRKLLAFGEMQAIVAAEQQSVSQPVPDKVLNEMRSCGAAIIHVEDELRLVDDEANEHKILNANVLIEIGAAIALYGRRFILLVKEGVELPSNLQGLFEVRYTGGTLDGSVTIKLLEAINDMKKVAPLS